MRFLESTIGAKYFWKIRECCSRSWIRCNLDALDTCRVVATQRTEQHELWDACATFFTRCRSTEHHRGGDSHPEYFSRTIYRWRRNLARTSNRDKNKIWVPPNLNCIQRSPVLWLQPRGILRCRSKLMPPESSDIPITNPAPTISSVHCL